MSANRLDAILTKLMIVIFAGGPVILLVNQNNHRLALVHRNQSDPGVHASPSSIHKNEDTQSGPPDLRILRNQTSDNLFLIKDWDIPALFNLQT